MVEFILNVHFIMISKRNKAISDLSMACVVALANMQNGIISADDHVKSGRIDR